MRSHSALALLVLLAACGDDDDDLGQQPDDSGTDTGPATDSADPTVPPTDTELPPWVVSGQEGMIILVDRARGGGLQASYGVHAMFADSLQGVATAPWCTAGGPCLTEIPAAGASADGLATAVDPLGSTWSWNGHDLVVGSLTVPFDYDLTSGLAWYSTTETSSVDPSPIAISFDGEWGVFNGEIPLPEPLELTSPDPVAALDLSAPVKFRWTPTGQDDVFLSVKASGYEKVYHLEDDGEYDLDTSEIPMIVGGQTIVTVARWDIQQVDVNGNDLTMVGIWEQPFTPLVCEDADYPVGNIAASGAPAQPTISPASVAVSFQALLNGEEIRDFWLDDDLDGQDTLYSSALTFSFYDDADAFICSIAYDASDATYVGAQTASGSGTIIDAWELELVGGSSSGPTACRALDPLVWGTKDLRDVLEGLTWGFGVGTVADTQTELEAIYDWAAWEPLLGGSYILYGDEWIEVGSVASVGMDTCGVIDADLLALEKAVASPLPTRLYLSTPVVKFGLGG